MGWKAILSMVKYLVSMRTFKKQERKYLCIMAKTITHSIDYCCELLEKGEVVAIPTETVYGLAASIRIPDAIEKIFNVKGRPKYNPLIVHITGVDELSSVAKDIPEKALQLATNFWPGPLTLILPKREGISDLVTAGMPTVGVRVPGHPLTLKLLKQLDFPIAAPSANPFTRISPTSAKQVQNYFGDTITVLDGGSCQVGLESTIVGFENGTPIIYRKGGIAIEAIEALVGKVNIVEKEITAPVAPGMLAKHYSPKTELWVVTDIAKRLLKTPHKKVGILAFTSTNFDKATMVKTLSPNANLEEAAKNLYTYLNELDDANLDLIIAEKFPEVGLGVSINDRLKRASYR